MTADRINSAASATDPVCGMTVDPAGAIGTTLEGRNYYFCAPGCLQRFEADPKAFLDPPPAAPAPSGTVYVCPMDPDVRETKPGCVPQVRDGARARAPGACSSRTEWTCPMHPEIVRDAPGSCPICGMALEPRTVAAEERRTRS